MGGNEYGESGHLFIFTLLKHLMMLLKYNFFRASFLHLTKDTDRLVCRPCSSDFFKVKTLLNNAFYVCDDIKPYVFLAQMCHFEIESLGF